jgi:polyisoprenoid-binding protein YceI
VVRTRVEVRVTGSRGCSAKWKTCWILLLASLLSSLPLTAQKPETPPPKPRQSAVTIKVFKSGFFSGFAHNHIVVAPVSRAEIDPAKLTAEITVVTKDMKVTDPEVSDKDRAEIQSTMLGPKVLDPEKYPEVHFKSSRIEQAGPQHYRVAGTLELHGAKREITLEVAGDADGIAGHYHGSTRLKQSDYGMKPISLFGGSVKVKDELELAFDVYSATPAAAAAPGKKK